MTRIDCRPVNKYQSYTIRELAPLLEVDERTLGRWMDKGLRIVSGSKKPILILGADLKGFIKSKDSRGKVKLKRHEFYCLKCKAARRAKRGSIKTLSDRKIGNCSVCSGKMSRTIKPYQKGLFDTHAQHSNVHYPKESQTTLL